MQITFEQYSDLQKELYEIKAKIKTFNATLNTKNQLIKQLRSEIRFLRNVIFKKEQW